MVLSARPLADGVDLLKRLKRFEEKNKKALTFSSLENSMVLI
jgi:hypothetical protein